MVTSTRTPISRCTCGVHLDAATGREGTAPSAGAISLCGYCGATWVFAEDLTLAPLDIATLPPAVREQVQTMQARIRARRPS